MPCCSRGSRLGKGTAGSNFPFPIQPIFTKAWRGSSVQSDSAQTQCVAGMELPRGSRTGIRGIPSKGSCRGCTSLAEQPSDAGLWAFPLLHCLTRLHFGSDWKGDLTALPGNHCPNQGVRRGEGEARALLFSPQSTEQTGRCDVLTNVLYCTFSTIMKDFVEY